MRGSLSIASAFLSLAGGVAVRPLKLFSIILFLLFSLWPEHFWAQAPEEKAPLYSWLKSVDLPTLTVSSLNTQDITIAIATDPQGNVYTLSFGAGVDKWNAEGVLIENDFIPAGQLDNPLDIAVDEQGYIYIADYLDEGESFEDNGKIKVFDPQGTYLPARTILTSFYRPLGIDVDSEKVYVAEYNDGNSGPETTPMSRVSIYDKLSTIRLDYTDQAEVPYRIAVNSQGRIYVSQAGNGDPAVLVFDSGLNIQGKLADVTSPGSVVVDPFDFVHVIEYDNRIDFAEFINFESLGLGDILDISEQVYRGQRDEEFKIKVFDPDHSLVRTVVQNIDFPLDMAFNPCDRMYVNNATIIGEDFPYIGFIPSKMEFDLEIYRRTPSFDIEDPVIECVADIVIAIPPGQSSAQASFSKAQASDNCSAAIVTQTKGPSSGSQLTEGTYEVEFTAEDEAGNTSTCSILIVVEAEEAEAAMENCPSDITVGTDPDECGAIVNFTAPTAKEGGVALAVTRTSGLDSGSLFPVGSTTVSFQSTASDGEILECSFKVIVNDIEAPVIECISDIEVRAEPGKDFHKVNFSDIIAADNCSATAIQTKGPASGSEFPIGTTLIEYTATDTAGLTDVCSFNVIVREAEPPSIECPSEEDLPVVELDQDCTMEETDFKYLLETFNNFEHEPYIEQDQTREGYLLHVALHVYDGKGGAFVETCEFQLQLVDRIKPVIDCPGSPQTLSPNADGEYILPDYSERLSDNCDDSPVFTQVPPPGEITEGGTVTLSATDASGNTALQCEFEVVLLPQGVPSFTCPTGSEIPELTLDENCDYDLPDLDDLVSDLKNFETSALIITETQEIDDHLQVLIKVYDGFEEEDLLVGECSFTIELIDATAPVASCISDLTVQLDAEGMASISPEDLDAGSFDSCGSVDLSLSQNTFTTADLANSPLTVILTVTDADGNTDSCATLITVEDYDPDEPFSCISSLTLELDTNGQVILDPEQLYEGSLGPGASVSVDKEIFTCADLGEQRVTLTYSGTRSGTCPITIMVVDNTPPVPRTKNIEVSLDENGQASLVASQLDDGSSDNCSTDLEFSISRSTFACQDLGENKIELEVKDASGNSATAEVSVQVTDPQDYCVVDPVEPPAEGRFLILFPNPGRGEVQIATSEGIELHRVEIFDMRGRFLDARELTFNPQTQSYHLDLKNYQTGVYTLKIYSNTREYIRRAIITTFSPSQ